MGTSSPIIFHRGLQVTTSTGQRRNIARLNSEKFKITRWLHDVWNAQGNDLRLEDISDALASGDLGARMFSNWRSKYIDYVDNMATAWKATSETGGQFVIDGLFKSAALRQPMQYDAASKAISHYFQTRGTEFVGWMSDGQQRGVNFLLDYFSTQKPLTIPEMGRVLRASVGLSDTQSRALVKFTKALENTVPKLTKGQIASKVFKREKFMIRQRADAIAENEIKKAYNAAHQDAYRQVTESGALSPEFSGMIPVKIWDASPECCVKKCCPLHGEAVAVDDNFSDGNNAPPAHMRCDCWLNSGLMTPEELGLTAEENRAISEARDVQEGGPRSRPQFFSRKTSEAA